MANVEAGNVSHWVVPGGKQSGLLGSSLGAIRRLCDLSDLDPDELDRLDQSFPTGEYVRNSYLLVVTSGQNP